MLRRWLQNLTTTHFALWRCYPAATLTAIDAAITASERHHRAEIRCAIETVLSVGQLLRGVSAPARAAEVFSHLGVWDTDENNGVLLYVLLAERTIEIVPDRGFAAAVSPAEWAGICAEMEVAFGAGRYEEGTLTALDRISVLACRHFPARGDGRNELPDPTVLL